MLLHSCNIFIQPSNNRNREFICFLCSDQFPSAAALKQTYKEAPEHHAILISFQNLCWKEQREASSEWGGGGGGNWSGGSSRPVSRWKPSVEADFTSRPFKLTIWERAGEQRREGGRAGQGDDGGWLKSAEETRDTTPQQREKTSDEGADKKSTSYSTRAD